MRRLLAGAEVLNNSSPAGTVSAEAGVLCEGDPPVAKRSLPIAWRRKKGQTVGENSEEEAKELSKCL